jgi:hypothetical protein
MGGLARTKSDIRMQKSEVRTSGAKRAEGTTSAFALQFSDFCLLRACSAISLQFSDFYVRRVFVGL